MALFRKRPHREVSFEGSWMVLTGTHNDQPLIARFDTSTEQLKGRYSIQIGVAVPLNNPTSEGWPTPEEDQQLSKIEAKVIGMADKESVLTGVITTGGMREFVLHQRQHLDRGLPPRPLRRHSHPRRPGDGQDRPRLVCLQILRLLTRTCVRYPRIARQTHARTGKTFFAR